VTRWLFRLRPEEAVALAFLAPTTYLTVAANVYAQEAGVLGARHPGGVLRLGVAALVLAVLALALHFLPRAPWVQDLRDILPFLVCILVYTNLHDTIGFVNPHDVHDGLVALDVRLFGVEPVLWAERFITAQRTEVMQFFYVNFFWIAPSASLILLARRRRPEFRATTMAIMTCFYLGYFLYVVFPAAPPRLVLVSQFTKNLYGYPQFFSKLNADAFALLPVDSRAAFPSLHTAISLTMLVCSWRFLRVWFWISLPFVLGLWVSTIYLRHHYVVDLLAGFALAPVALWLAPRVDGFWAGKQREQGEEPARGAPLPSGEGRDGLRGPGPTPEAS
jgi:membrane-associated phospholipid phosphatase